MSNENEKYSVYHYVGAGVAAAAGAVGLAALYRAATRADREDEITEEEADDLEEEIALSNPEVTVVRRRSNAAKPKNKNSRTATGRRPTAKKA